MGQGVGGSGDGGDGGGGEEGKENAENAAARINDEDGTKAALLWNFCERFSEARGVSIDKLYLWIDYSCLDWSHAPGDEVEEESGKTGAEKGRGGEARGGRAENDGRILTAQRLAAPLYIMCCDEVAFVNDMNVLTQAYSRTYLFLRWLTRRSQFSVVAIPDPSDSEARVSDRDGIDRSSSDEGQAVESVTREEEALAESAEGFVVPRDSYSTSRPFSIIRIGPGKPRYNQVPPQFAPP